MPKMKPEALEARRNQILQAALKCFVDAGYHKTSVDDIASQAGLSKGSIYTHFESKHALLLTLLTRVSQVTDLPGILGAETTTEQEKFSAVLEGIISYVQSGDFQDYAALLMVAWREAQSDLAIRQTVAGLYAGMRGGFSQLIQQGIESGQIEPIDARSFASILIAIFDGLMIQAMVDDQAIDWQAVAETIRGIWIY
ncbi:MAG: TetR/AcrR family transcriptional regulator [Ardenticatenaceae bacterium]|nr:TetR/AcrR family transcriptional regulator [Anaerolineales bacterium]MCB8986104.1 TetR/AcrR family transcriptional regulator [Ardenticatenaceae bacterium]